MKIVEALQQLDPQDESQWTQGGLPRLEFLQAILERIVTRQEVTDAAPLFTRENPDLTEGTAVEEEEDPEVRLAKANEELETAQKKLQKAREDADAALLAKDRNSEPDHITNMKNIRYWLDRQQQNRMAKVEKRKEIFDKLSTEDIKSLGARSPLDQALARRSPRETIRVVENK